MKYKFLKFTLFTVTTKADHAHMHWKECDNRMRHSLTECNAEESILFQHLSGFWCNKTSYVKRAAALGLAVNTRLIITATEHVCMICHWLTANSANFEAFISLGSVVTCLRCGGIFNDGFIANLVDSVLVKRFFIIGQYLMKK